MKLRFFQNGLTIIELLTVVGIIAILVVLAIPAFRVFEKQADLNNSTEEVINNFRLAQKKTLGSESASQYGVYFSTSTSPHQYVLFRGSSYGSRNTAFDEIHSLPKAIEISGISLGGGKEVVFQRLNGESSQSGSVTLGVIGDASRRATVYIEQSGVAGTASPTTPSDSDRLKDSRHIHIDYSRNVATATEKIILTSGSYIQEIIIANNLRAGQIYWEGSFNVNGQIQQLKIDTHRLNGPDSQFSVHRDGTYNNQVLKVELSGDSSGSLVEYSADGTVVIKSSIFASNPQWQ